MKLKFVQRKNAKYATLLWKKYAKNVHQKLVPGFKNKMF